MSRKLIHLCFGLWTLFWVYQAAAQSPQYFRISGPAATKITGLREDGLLVWSNSLAGTNYTVQVATSMVRGVSWKNLIQISVTSRINTNQVTVPVGMAFIPAGSFTIGDSIDGNRIGYCPPTNVYLSAYYIDKNLVSYTQWQAIYNYATNCGYVFNNAGKSTGPQQPIQSVDWYDCVKWNNARSQQAGLTPVYYTDATLKQVYTNGDYPTTVYANWQVSGYRLPTEAEWEKAARGGWSGLRFPYGNTISEMQANYLGDTNSLYDLGPNGYNYVGLLAGYAFGIYTTPVGSFPPNSYGLYDMAGNVSQFCWDSCEYLPPYPSGSPYLGGVDPKGPATGDTVVIRGGSWQGGSSQIVCYARYACGRSNYTPLWGFRCVRRL